MELPLELKNNIENIAQEYSISQLRKTAALISERYMSSSGKGKRLVTTPDEALVYSIMRMPATYGAVSRALRYALEGNDLQVRTMLDVGAGTGAAGWAVCRLDGLEKLCCLEREPVMSSLGKEFMREGNELLRNSEWISGDLRSLPELHSYDMVTACYVLNELEEEDRITAVNELWERSSKMLLVVEPGTPEGFRQLKAARKQLLDRGAHIAAPCVYEKECRLEENDWCHFTVRVQRSRIHKYLKQGDVPYEDEKFCYMAFVREPVNVNGARILRHPQKAKGRVTLQLCKAEENCSVMITKKDPSYKYASKADCGDRIIIEE